MQYLQASSFDGRHRRAVGLDWTLAIGTPTPFPPKGVLGAKPLPILLFSLAAGDFPYRVPCMVRVWYVYGTVYGVLMPAVLTLKCAKVQAQCIFPPLFFFAALHGGKAEVDSSS